MRALTIGVTGGIGAGKSLACLTVKNAGSVVIDTDELAREQAKPGGIAHRPIVKAFGTADRKKLAEIVFKHAAKRRKLEKITHPLILKELARRLKAAKETLAFVAVPLLFETKLEKLFDVTMTIEAPEAVRRRRVAKRDALTEAQIRARMRAQLSEKERVRRADVVLRNSGSKPKFLATVRSYHRALTLLRQGAAAAR